MQSSDTKQNLGLGKGIVVQISFTLARGKRERIQDRARNGIAGGLWTTNRCGQRTSSKVNPCGGCRPQGRAWRGEEPALRRPRTELSYGQPTRRGAKEFF